MTTVALFVKLFSVHLAYNPSYSACFFNRNSIFLSQKSANSIFQPAYNFSRTAPKALRVSLTTPCCAPGSAASMPAPHCPSRVTVQ
jgi:hypothetical protein